MKSALFRRICVCVFILHVFPGVSDAYYIYEISGDWTVEYTELHNKEHEVYTEYNPDGSIDFVGETDIINEDVPSKSVIYGSATQVGDTISGYIESEDGLISNFTGTISDKKVVFTLITPEINEEYHETSFSHIYIATVTTTELEGTYDPETNVITATCESSQDRAYQEWWFYGPDEHYSYDSTNISYGGIVRIEISGNHCPPVAKFKYSMDGNMVYFDGSPSYDPDGGEIVRYIWDFGDGNIQEVKVVGIIYTEAGLKKVKLTVVDDEGQQSSIERDIPILIYDDKVWTLNLENCKEFADKAWRAGLLAEMTGMVWFESLGLLSNFKLFLGISKGVFSGEYDGMAPEKITKDFLSSKVSEEVYSLDHKTRLELLKSLQRIADDPPDPDYTEIAKIEPFDKFEPIGDISLEIHIINYTNIIAENQAILKALITSIERFQGALQANENKYVALHAQAIKCYSKMMVQNSGGFGTVLSDLIFTIESIQSNHDVLNDMEGMRQRLATEGFTEEEIQYFKSIGMNDSDIEAYKQTLSNFSISNFRYEIDEFQKLLNEGILAYSDLYDQASYITEMYNGTLPPGIEFMQIPSFGSLENLSGWAWGVNPSDYNVAIYIYVPPYGWWTKPYSNEPLTSIASDGTWICDITTGVNDHNATKIIVFLVPNGYNPPLAEGQQCLDSELYQYPHTNVIRYQKISFSGYDWWVKRASDPIGPGPNYFSDSNKNVWLDSNGYLHMGIVQVEGKWYCSEVIADVSLGYGTYVFTVKGRVDLLDQNIVLGMFTWEDCVSQYNYREMDIELSKWGNPANDNAQFVVQPWDLPGNRFRFNIDLSGHPNETTTHEFTWQQNGIDFQSYHGDFSSNPLAEDIIASWYYTGSDIPPAGAENPRINLWLLPPNGAPEGTPGAPPMDGQDAEIVVRSFQYLPIGGTEHHPADMNCNYVISILEILDYIDQWAVGDVKMLEVLEGIELWSAGHYYWDPIDKKFKPGELP